MRRRRAIVAVLALPLLAAACGMQPAPFPASDGELGTRPGLLSGPTGEVSFGCCSAALPARPAAAK